MAQVIIIKKIYATGTVSSKFLGIQSNAESMDLCEFTGLPSSGCQNRSYLTTIVQTQLFSLYNTCILLKYSLEDKTEFHKNKHKNGVIIYKSISQVFENHILY